MEKDFGAQIMRWHDSNKLGHLQRIPDTPWAQNRQNAFQFRKPYDIYWLYKGHFHALELKQEKGMSFSLSHIAEHQEEHLLKVIEEGGSGWMVINFNGPLSKKASEKYGLSKLNHTFAIRMDDIVEHRVVTGLDRLELDWLLKNAVIVQQVELPDGKTPAQRIGWDLTILSKNAILQG